jgi:hypothetical protein
VNISDTPETDAAEWSWYEDCTPENEMIVPANIARKLERERDEAREDVMKLQDIKRKHEHEELVAAQENDRLKQERDEARQQLRIAVGLLSAHPQFANKHPEDVLAFV